MDSIGIFLLVWNATVFSVLHFSLFVTALMAVAFVVHFVGYCIGYDTDWEEGLAIMKSTGVQHFVLACVTFASLCILNYATSGGYLYVKYLF